MRIENWFSKGFQQRRKAFSGEMCKNIPLVCYCILEVLQLYTPLQLYSRSGDQPLRIIMRYVVQVYRDHSDRVLSPVKSTAFLHVP